MDGAKKKVFLTCTGVTTLWTAFISFETLTIKYTPASSETMARVCWTGLTVNCGAIVVRIMGTCCSFIEKGTQIIKIERRHLKPYERLRGMLASEFGHPLSILLLAVEFLNQLFHMETA